MIQNRMVQEDAMPIVLVPVRFLLMSVHVGSRLCLTEGKLSCLVLPVTSL